MEISVAVESHERTFRELQTEFWIEFILLTTSFDVEIGVSQALLWMRIDRRAERIDDILGHSTWLLGFICGFSGKPRECNDIFRLFPIQLANNRACIDRLEKFNSKPFIRMTVDRA